MPVPVPQETRKDAIRRALLMQRARLRGEVADLDTDVLKLAESGRQEGGPAGDAADVASDLLEQTVAYTLGHLARARLEDIDDALERIDAQDYGMCDDCHEPIDPARLSALPWARRCLRCQRRAEQRSRSFEPR